MSEGGFGEKKIGEKIIVCDTKESKLWERTGCILEAEPGDGYEEGVEHRVGALVGAKGGGGVQIKLFLMR